VLRPVFGGVHACSSSNLSVYVYVNVCTCVLSMCEQLSHSFPNEAHRKGFDTMRDAPSLWDWNSNDADVCCSDAPSGTGSWLVWGASTQGAKPKPPAKHGCTNAMGFVNTSLPELLESFFA